MRFKNTDKGVAGLTILLSLVTLLFVIGLLVMIFALMGGELQDATYTDTAVTVSNESGTFMNITGDALAGGNTVNALNSDTYVITAVWNETTEVLLLAGNYSVDTTTGVFTNASTSEYSTNNYLVNVSYTYQYDATNTATEVMNDTTVSVATVTDWFPIFIVIGAMVVLILLTVIIITAIRGSGLMAGESG